MGFLKKKKDLKVKWWRADCSYISGQQGTTGRPNPVDDDDGGVGNNGNAFFLFFFK